MIPGNGVIKSGELIQERVIGGRPDGKVTYRQLKPTAGVKCKLSTRQDVATVSGKGEGVCTLVAMKPGNKQFNDVKSGPVQIRVTR